mmetsp:Transcript_4250/g.5876  ORF Transcript_4250/g.5876 Transcript_4250/m.5876 type:complete len:342 (+) Transcript_4250:168-1193(+)|eukprot:CAMPEP_0117752504 /NCGR_PEP_ID=MMETSP0947-20121206/11645_1 /TAXON_ID=44440 /ORGANISM="Chattonella subsalsa, Strain CCMP2191" /LENGTH=341 /DNA_ID=CAMNT_0005571159 /DNA_START=161 /DNA_END=1186 /DNA_ORIENTATION=+
MTMFKSLFWYIICLATANGFVHTPFKSMKRSQLTMSDASFLNDGHEEFKAKVALRGLRSERFRHPIDRQATAQLQRIPGLEQIIRQGSPLVEEAVFLENISTSILVGPKQMSSLHGMLMEACRILDIKDPPQLYVKQNPVPNAYTMAIQGKKPFIVVHTSLIELMTPAEIQAVLAHELGHIKCEHGLWLSAANLITLGLLALGGLPGQLAAEALGQLVLPWQRAAEFSCDRAALLVAQDPEVVISTMLKLVGGVGASSLGEMGSLSAEEFLKQAEEYNRASNSPVGRMMRDSQQQTLTHPLPVIRAQELAKWSKSPEYKGLMRRGTPIADESDSSQTLSSS